MGKRDRVPRGEPWLFNPRMMAPIVGGLLFALTWRVGLAEAVLVGGLAAVITYGLLNAPPPYRRFSLGQIQEAADNKHGIFGRSYPQERIARRVWWRRLRRNDSCPCGSGEKFKRCCGR